VKQPPYLIIETVTTSKYAQAEGGLVLSFYKRATLDGEYWAQTTGKQLWTRRPGAPPAKGGVFGNPQQAKAAVDHYMDRMVPHMLLERQNADDTALHGVPLRSAGEVCHPLASVLHQRDPGFIPEGELTGAGPGAALPPALCQHEGSAP
jgi:hypothetical protein